MPEKISEIHAALKDALFMQHDRGYVPEWMCITGWKLGINLNEPSTKPEITIKLDWHDTRGRLKIAPLDGTRLFMEEDWKMGLEAMAKMMIKEESEQWQARVNEIMASGAEWE